MKKNVVPQKFDENGRPIRCIRSFMYRQGRLTKRQQYALDNYWSMMGVEFKEQFLDFVALFGRDAPVTLEIGFGMGESLVTTAKEHPHLNFLGIEVYPPGVGACLISAHEKSVRNLRVIHYDAVEVLHKMIPDNSLYIVQLFFPDPWHKTRHNKRRIMQIPFATLINNKLKSGRVLHIATDWKPYKEHILKVISSSGNYKNKSIRNGHTSDLLSRPMTKFEQRGSHLGHEIWDLTFEKAEY